MKHRKTLLTAPAVIALLLSLCLSVTVYGAVSYDSSSDPVVALSGMQSYVTAYVADQLKTVNAAISALQTSVNALLSDMTSVKNTANTNKSSITALDQRVDSLESAAASSSGVDSAALKALEDRLKALEGKVTTLENEKTTLNGKVTALENEKATMKGKITALDGEVDRLSGENSSLSNEVNRLAGENTTLHSTLSQLETRLEETVAELTTVAGRISAVTTSELDLELLRERCRKLSADLDGIARSIDNIYTTVTVEGGATLRAVNGGTLIVIVTDGSAAVAFSDNGAVIDLSEGWELGLGAEVPLMHNILVSGSGSLMITSNDEAVILVGGEYEIVNP